MKESMIGLEIHGYLNTKEKLFCTCKAERHSAKKGIKASVAFGHKTRQKDNDVEKVLIIGDVKNKNLRQSSISIGEGVKAAMEMYNEIKGETACV